MREIIVLQIGACGNQLGNLLWREISREHQIDFQDVPQEGDDNLLERCEVYYDELKTGNYALRAILEDTNLDCLKESVRTGSAGIAFPETSYVTSGLKGWSSKGYYTIGQFEIGPELTLSTIEKIRKILEECDRPQCFRCYTLSEEGRDQGRDLES